MTSALPAPAVARISSTPYARRLARERSIPLSLIRGSGPNGRVVGADVAAYVPAPTAVQAATLSISALAATISLSAAHKLLADFGNAGHTFVLEDAVLRAIGCTLAEEPETSGDGEITVALEAGRRQVCLRGLDKLSLAPISTLRENALTGVADDAAEDATLSLRVLSASGIRPVVMPLLAGRSLRLVLSAGAESGEALLVFDAMKVDEDLAASLLGRFVAYMENPLRLLA